MLQLRGHYAKPREARISPPPVSHCLTGIGSRPAPDPQIGSDPKSATSNRERPCPSVDPSHDQRPGDLWGNRAERSYHHRYDRLLIVAQTIQNRRSELGGDLYTFLANRLGARHASHRLIERDGLAPRQKLSQRNHYESVPITPQFARRRPHCLSTSSFGRTTLRQTRTPQALHQPSTSCRATLFHVAMNQNITLRLPRELLRRIKRLAADRDTSVSALMAEALAKLADENRRYSAARRRSLAALQAARSLGVGGSPRWSREELHER